MGFGVGISFLSRQWLHWRRLYKTYTKQFKHSIQIASCQNYPNHPQEWLPNMPFPCELLPYAVSDQTVNLTFISEGKLQQKPDDYFATPPQTPMDNSTSDL